MNTKSGPTNSPYQFVTPAMAGCMKCGAELLRKHGGKTGEELKAERE
mgnify:FL=1